MLRPLLLVFAALLGAALASPSSAQTVEYELPSSIEVVPGRLAVTFADTVAEDAAVAFVEAQGFRVDSVLFYDVRVSAGADTTLAADVVRRLEADPRVRSVEQRRAELPDDAPDYLKRHFPRYAVTVLFAPEASWTEARAVVSDVPGLRDVRVRKLPNDLIVAVDDEAEALDALEASPLVAYVTYIAAGASGGE